MGSRPAAIIAISFSLGIGLAQLCREYAFCAFALSCAILVVAAFLAWRRDRINLALSLGSAAIILVGLLTALAHRDGIPDNHIRRMISQSSFHLNEPVLFDGCVIEEAEKRGQETVTTVELHGFMQKDRWIASQGKAILRIANLDNSNGPPVQGAALSAGDRVRGWAAWRPPQNFQNPGSADIVSLFAGRGIFLIGRAKSPRLLEPIPGDCSNIAIRLSNSIRHRVRNSLEPLNREGKSQAAAVLSSLVIGDYSQLGNSTREIFQNSGTYHVLVVSGLHVVWIAGIIMAAFRCMRFPERIRYFSAALAILLYAAVIGFQPSITRCLWMFILYLIGRMLVRRSDPANLLFTSALLLLCMEPDWLFEIGFQLSFISVMAIALTAAPAIDKYLKPLLDPLSSAGLADRLFLQTGSWQRMGRRLRVRCELAIENLTDSFIPPAHSRLLFIVRLLAGAAMAVAGMFLVSLSVQIWLEPLLAFYFNRMSWISPLANLAIVPLSSLALAAGIASSAVMNIPWLGSALLHAAAWASTLLLYCAERITMIPGAWQRCPTPSALWVALGFLILFPWAFFQWRRFWIPCSYIMLLLAFLSFGWHPALLIREKEDSLLKITFLDVGEGDSAVISFPNGQHWAVDAGGLHDNSSSLDIGEAVVSRYLWDQWITKLDRALLSHPDVDHAGGMPALMKNFRILRFDYSQANDPILNDILKIARTRKMQLNEMHAGMEEQVGETRIRIFNPPLNAQFASSNENSVVMKISFKRFSALFTGDLDKMGESQALQGPWDLICSVLKAAHHGSKSATTNPFLDRTRPQWAILSAGRYNPFGHPSKETIARLIRHGAQPLLTSSLGAITVETNGNEYAIKSYVLGLVGRRSLLGTR
jgi:competence protein ComEC